MAGVAVNEALTLWLTPSAKPKDEVTPGLAPGTIVFLIEGPRVVKGQTWWHIQTDHSSTGISRLGWVQATDLTGNATLLPYAPTCPAAQATITAKVLTDLGDLASLACFGNRALTMTGVVTCHAVIADFGIGGPSWLDPYGSCTLDDGLFVAGSPIAVLVPRGGGVSTGKYEVTGHFDDAEATRCHRIDIGGPLYDAPTSPEPDAITQCREEFIVTHVTKLD